MQILFSLASETKHLEIEELACVEPNPLCVGWFASCSVALLFHIGGEKEKDGKHHFT